jgi:hypothetical protein
VFSLLILIFLYFHHRNFSVSLVGSDHSLLQDAGDAKENVNLVE